MDFVDYRRTKKVARKRGTPIQKPRSIDIGLNSFSDEDSGGSSDKSRFSQVDAHHDRATEKETRAGENERKKRQHTKDLLAKSQQEKDRREKGVEDLTGDSDSPSPEPQKSQKQRSFFDGVRTDICTNEAAQKRYEKFQKMATNVDDSFESVEPKPRREPQPKQRKGRGASQQQNSLSRLSDNRSQSQRMLNRERREHQPTKYQQRVESGARASDDPLDQAQEEQWINTRAASKSNFTQSMTSYMDAILNHPKQKYGGGNTMTKRRKNQEQNQLRREREQKERDLREQQRKEEQQQAMTRIPRKQRSSSSSFEESREFPVSPLSKINAFNAQNDEVNTSFGSTGKRKKRECVVDQVEIVHSPKKRQSRDRAEIVTNSDGEEVPVAPMPCPVNLVDEDMTEVHSDHDDTTQYRYTTPAHDTYQDDDDITGALASCEQPYTYEELERSRTPRGRQPVYDEVQSSYEAEINNKRSPTDLDVDVEMEKARGGVFNLGLTKANNGGNQGRSKAKNGKTHINIGTAFLQGKDEIHDSDTDDVAAAGKKNILNSDVTMKRLKCSGMAVQTQRATSDVSRINTRKTRSNRDSDDEWNSPSSDKTKGTPKQRQSTLGLSHSTAGRRKTRSHSKPREGATEENAISIDSDSDESSLGDLAADASTTIDDDVGESPTQGVQTRATRADGNLAILGVARLAIGKKVLKSNCALKFQFGTKEPYLRFCYSEGKSEVRLRVNLQGDDLKELNYYLAEDDENNGNDDSMSIIAFRVKPSKQNGLDRFSEWYDGEERKDNCDKTYITMEIRDKEDFPAMLEQMKVHRDLRAFCTDEARLEDYHLGRYNTALLKDDKAEKAKRRSGPRTRGKNTSLSSSENKLLVVYPFKVEEEKLQQISSKLTELRGDRLGVVETPVIVSDTDDPDTNEEGNEEDGNPESSGTSSRTHYLTIREDDRERLQPGQFLNDTLVDFWMSWISRNQRSSNASNDAHFFTSHFLTTLEDEGTKGVASWTLKKKRKISVFDKKFIFVPVNADLHWSLCVIVNPGRIVDVVHATGQVSDAEDGEEEKEWPCILFLDSLKMHRKDKVAKLMVKWLNFEWNRSMQDTEGFVKSPFNKDTMKLVAPKVPYQENGCDCGVFVCRYAYNLYIMRDQIFSCSEIKNKFKNLITNGPAFQFGMEEIARIREEFRDLINSLRLLYLEHKLKEKELKLLAKKQENEGCKTNAKEDIARQEEKENSSPQTEQEEKEPAL